MSAGQRPWTRTAALSRAVLSARDFRRELTVEARDGERTAGDGARRGAAWNAAQGGRLVGTCVCTLRERSLVRGRVELTLCSWFRGARTYTQTPSAVGRLKELMATRPGSMALRVGVAERGCNGLTYTMQFADKKQPLDAEIKQDGTWREYGQQGAGSREEGLGASWRGKGDG